MEVIGNYVEACAGLGVPTQDLFEPTDLLDGEGRGMKSVVRNLHSLGRVVQRTLPAFEGPRLGARLATRNTRSFNEAQLAQARGTPTKWSTASAEASPTQIKPRGTKEGRAEASPLGAKRAASARGSRTGHSPESSAAVGAEDGATYAVEIYAVGGGRGVSAAAERAAAVERALAAASAAHAEEMARARSLGSSIRSGSGSPAATM